MSQEEEDFTYGGEEPTTVVYEKQKLSFWRKLGGGSLSISIILHAILLAIGVVWVLQIIPAEQKKNVDFMPASGGGGSPDSQSQTQQKKRANMMRQNMPRVVAQDVASEFTLPEPEAMTEMASMGEIGSGGMAGGLGGSGSGGGKGDGTGQGFGSGSGMGLTPGGTGLVNPFGMINPNENALEGTFYDLKQTNKKKPSEVTTESIRGIIKEFTNRGWRESILKDYYQASQKLYQTKIYIPIMSADGAPAAFNCEKEVQPKLWVVVYRGMVTPPRSGKFRFVGSGDDVLVVRFNGKHVFDHGFTSGTTGVHLSGKGIKVLKEEEEDDNMIAKLKEGEYPMKLPVKFYEYDSTRNWNGTIGGLAVGKEFEVEAGKKYPIEILLSEIPGGLFCASLLIEEIGEKYQPSSNGSPIFPLFRLDGSLPEPTKADNAPPYDPNGPIWKRVQGRGKVEF